MATDRHASGPKLRILGLLAGLLCLIAGLWIVRLSGGAPLRLGFGLLVVFVGLDALIGALLGRRFLLQRIGKNGVRDN